MTRQRAVILEIVHTPGCHHTAEEIFNLAKQRLPGISRATVYNNLRELEREAAIGKLVCDDLTARYDCSSVPHGHLFCTECGGIFDFSIPNFNTALEEFADCMMNTYELKLRGVCRSCLKTKQQVV